MIYKHHLLLMRLIIYTPTKNMRICGHNKTIGLYDNSCNCYLLDSIWESKMHKWKHEPHESVKTPLYHACNIWLENECFQQSLQHYQMKSVQEIILVYRLLNGNDDFPCARAFSLVPSFIDVRRHRGMRITEQRKLVIRVELERATVHCYCRIIWMCFFARHQTVRFSLGVQ